MENEEIATDVIIDNVVETASVIGEGTLRILILLAVSIGIIIAAKIVNAVVKRMLHKATLGVGRVGRLTPLMSGFLFNVLRALVWIIAALAVLQVWGINMAPIIAGLGVAGVVLGFALQESIGSIFSGLLIALNNPFGVGDFVQLGSVSGTVTGMDTISVTLTTGDNKKVTMSNKLVMSDAIINYSAMDRRRVDMLAQVAYGTDLEKAKTICADLINSYPEVLRDPAPVVEINSLSSSSVDIIVRPWTANGDYWKVYWRFQKDIYEKFKEEGVEIPFNQMDIHVHNA